MKPDLTPESRRQLDIGHTLRIISQIARRLPRVRLYQLGNAVEALSADDLQELEDAARLIRNFINNV